MAKNQTLRFHLKIYGQVQGVGFRFAAIERARELGLTGWVRNCEDDCVEVVCEGEREKVEAMRKWAEKGPAWARVDRVEASQEPPADLKEFEIR